MVGFRGERGEGGGGFYSTSRDAVLDISSFFSKNSTRIFYLKIYLKYNNKLNYVDIGTKSRRYVRHEQNFQAAEIKRK